MIVPDLDVCRGRGCRSAPEDDVVAGGFQEVINDLERAHRKISGSPREGLGVSASTCHRNAVKVGEVRVDHCHEASSAEEDAAIGFILRRAVHPYPIKDNMVRGSVLPWLDKVLDGCPGGIARDFQSH